MACASGMAALMNTFLNMLSSGDELISSASLYGGTIDLFHDLEAFGITTRYVENNNRQQIEDSINEHTRLILQRLSVIPVWMSQILRSLQR